MVLSLCFFPVVLGGCLGGGTQQKARFYVLNSVYSSKTDTRTGTIKGDVSIGVGPVELPQYVNRSQIVTRTSSNELELGEFARWAEPLEDNFPRVLAENLAILLPTARVITYPWKQSIPIDYQVIVDVSLFDGALGGDVSMRVRWALLGDHGKKMLLRRNASLNARTGARSYEALVAAQSRVLADLSSEIAEEIIALSEAKNSGQ
jgi:uncharacterized lipoprotein YmbA